MEDFIKILKSGGIGVLPTDTLYGLVGSALNKKAVERIYQVRKRRSDKPMIVLISSLKDLGLFGIKPDIKMTKILKQYWPGKISIVLPCPLKKFEYLHRGTKTLAFRWPKNIILQKILKVTGPLAAPSANPEGLPPAKNIKEARNYFGGKVDFYLPAQAGVAGKIQKKLPSTLIEIVSDRVRVLRPGSVNIKTQNPLF